MTKNGSIKLDTVKSHGMYFINDHGPIFDIAICQEYTIITPEGEKALYSSKREFSSICIPKRNGFG